MTRLFQSLVGPVSEKGSFSMEDLAKVAEDLVHDTKTDPCPDGLWEQHPGTASAFWIYPQATAYRYIATFGNLVFA